MQVSFAVALGSFTYGYSISILGNTLSKARFYEDMKVTPGTPYATSIIALWNCILYVGGLLTCALVPFVGNRYGRKRVLFVGSLCSIVGSALQAGSVNPAMLSVARLICGFGIGFLMPGVPLYQAEIAPPSSRGLVVGLHGEYTN
jgi:MFS family permease